jgi:hypothetical protein
VGCLGGAHGHGHGHGHPLVIMQTVEDGWLASGVGFQQQRGWKRRLPRLPSADGRLRRRPLCIKMVLLDHLEVLDTDRAGSGRIRATPPLPISRSGWRRQVLRGERPGWYWHCLAYLVAVRAWGTGVRTLAWLAVSLGCGYHVYSTYRDIPSL